MWLQHFSVKGKINCTAAPIISEITINDEMADGCHDVTRRPRRAAAPCRVHPFPPPASQHRSAKLHLVLTLERQSVKVGG